MFSNTFFSHQTKQCFFSHEMNKQVQLYIEIRHSDHYIPLRVYHHFAKRNVTITALKKLNLGFTILRCFDRLPTDYTGSVGVLHVDGSYMLIDPGSSMVFHKKRKKSNFHTFKVYRTMPYQGS